MAGSGFSNDVMTADNVDFSGGFPVTGQVTTNGQILIGSAVAPNIRVGLLGSSDSSITWTFGAGTITGQVAGGTTVGKTITGNSGGALAPTAGNWNILGSSPVAGTSPVTTSGAASTLTVNVQKSQAIAATDATKVGLANFNSSHFSVDANGFVSLAGAGIAIDSVGTQTGTNPIAPTAAGLITINGAVVAAGTNPVRSDGTGANTMALEVQISQAIAATDATKIGLCNFNSSHFSVDANGFVALAGAGIAIDSIGTQTGTNPISPTAAGLVTINGAVVAAGTNPLRSNGTGANTMALEIQTSQALAAADATKIGICNFDSTSFAVAATGFVTLSTTGAGKTITGDSGGALSPTANNWNILGGPGITTTGSGSTLTINSVVFTDTTAATLAVDNGYNATAAGTYNMPATALQGEMIIVFCDTTGAVVLDCPALNFIRVGELITSSGGTMTSTKQGDSLTLRYRLSSLTWEAVSVVGTWLVA